jgi:hypothetical protein
MLLYTSTITGAEKVKHCLMFLDIPAAFLKLYNYNCHRYIKHEIIHVFHQTIYFSAVLMLRTFAKLAEGILWAFTFERLIWIPNHSSTILTLIFFFTSKLKYLRVYYMTHYVSTMKNF